jgi:DNA-binding NarL/FixJ family response regulator
MDAVVGEAGDGRAAVEQVRLHRPDVVLMDIRMPGMDGLEATRLLTANRSTARVLVLTTFDLNEYVFAALRAGASGFLLKDAPADQLLTAIRVIAAGDALIAPSVTRRLIAEFANQPTPTDRPAQLTPLSATCCACWPAACPTLKSRPHCSSAMPPSRPTCPAS